MRFWSVSLGHFIKHKSLIVEEYCVAYCILFFTFHIIVVKHYVHMIIIQKKSYFISWKNIFCDNWQTFLCFLVLINEFCTYLQATGKQKLVKPEKNLLAWCKLQHLIGFFSLCLVMFFLTIYKNNSHTFQK